MKQIQATPPLCRKDSYKVIEQVNKIPTREAMERNKFLRSVLESVRKT